MRRSRSPRLGRVMTVINAVIAGLCVVGILLLVATKPKASGMNDVGHLLGIVLLFAILDAAVIFLVLPPIWRAMLSEGARTAGKVLGVAALSLGVAVGVIVVFFAACWGVLGAGEAMRQ